MEEEQDELDGVMNKSADRVKRKDETWSDTNLTDEYNEKAIFGRLKCRNCGKTNSFEVLSTGSYETTARCSCGMYYIVHCG